MPQMETAGTLVAPNYQILNAVKALGSSEYQSRVPDATKASISDTVERMWTYQPTRNEFINTLINQIGSIVLRDNSFTNPLAKFKRGMMTFGDTIEEIEVGLLNAYTYDSDREYLEKDIFGTEPNEVQARFYKINRQNIYKLSVKETILHRAFMETNGLTTFLQKLMQQPTTTDNWDEFLIMSSLFRTTYDAGGFYTVGVPAISAANSTADDAKHFLRTTRALAENLPFLSREYNPAHMPVLARPEQLELFITPEADAAMDVEALAAAFNLGNMSINARKTVVPKKNLNIPGAEAILTTRDWFVCADTYMEMRNSQNPMARMQNFFWHHDQIHAVSPFVPAILLSSTDVPTETITVQYLVDGISAFVVTDFDGATVSNSTVNRGGIYTIATGATTSPAGGPNDAVRLTVEGARSTFTRVSQTGILTIGQDEKANSIIVRATSVADPSFTREASFTVTGDRIDVTLGATVDTNSTTLTNRKLPTINPNTGGVGTTFVASNGTWDQQADSYTYVWAADGTPISGATGDTYTAASGDAGKALTVAVTAVKAGFASVSATSKPVTVAAA